MMPIDLLTGDVGGLPVSSDQVPSGAFEGQDWFSTSRALARLGESNNGYIPGDMTPLAQMPQEPLLSAEEANAKYGQKSQTGIVPDLSFSKPISDADAAAQNSDWHDRVARADAIARAPGGFFSGAARFGVNTAVFMLDPLNLAASMIPIVDEARLGGALARAGIDVAGADVFSRAVTRMATGFVSGAVNQTPLIALRGGLSWLEHGDYTSADATSDLIMGGVLGGGLHTVIDGVGDFMGRGFARTPAASEIAGNPVARDAAMRTATAQLLDGRPVEINGIVNVAAAERAVEDLRQWAAQHSIVDADEGRAIGDALAVQQPPDRTAAIEAAENRVGALQAELAQHQAELAGVRIRAGEGALDPATAERIAEIHNELAGTIPAARRADLQAELTMLVEGRDTAADALEAGRAAAQTRGSQASRERVQAALADAQAQLEQLQKQATTEAQQAAQARLAADRVLRVREIALASRRDVLAALQARTLRRFAGAIGADLQPGEAAELAQSINAGSRNAADVMRELSDRRGGIVRLTPGGDNPVSDALARGLRALRTQRDGALAELAASDATARAQGAASPEEIALRDAGQQALKEAQALKPDRIELAPELEDAAEIERQWKEMQGGEDAPDQTRGYFTAAERAEMRQMDEEFAQAKKDGDVWKAAAQCMVGE